MDTRDVTMNLQLGTVGVKYEDFHDFGKSYFKYVYKSAYERLDDIINRNWEMLKLESCVGESRYNEISNVLTFVGKRGTGKTSAMLSFMESLKGYDKILSQREGEMFHTFDHKDVLFTCLDCIDGSLLEKGEDIFQLVLAQMYQKFQYLYDNGHLEQSKEGEFGYQARELHKKLEDLYKETCVLDEMANHHVGKGESYINDLRKLASSQKLKEKFAALTKKYLEQMRYKYRSFQEMGRQHFLVITVDDIDLNIRNGFSMLEKIHRYLMIPNIIVLLSIDYQEMMQICMKNFYKVLLKYDSALMNGEEFVRELSVDYLDKVLPINYRIHMPDINERYAHYKINESYLQKGVKKLLFGNLFRKSGVIFDSQGRKRHFYEPKSVRVLADFFAGLNYLDNLPLFYELTSDQGTEKFPRQQRRIYNICEKNYQFLYSDLGTRLAFGIIEKEEQRRFFIEKVMKSDVLRAMEMVISYGIDKLAEHGIKRNKVCNYGVLINILYELGQIEAGDYKPLSCCLLAYFSYELTKVYVLENVRITDEDGNPIVEEGTFGGFLSGSIIGEWEKEMIPCIKTGGVEEKEIHESPYVNLPKIDLFDTAEGRYFSTWFDISLPWKTDFRREEHATAFQSIILEIEVLYLSLNCTNLGDVISRNWQFKIEEHPRKKSAVPHVRPMLYIESTQEEKIMDIRARFSIFNFVKNSLYARSELETLERKIIAGFTEYYGEEIKPFISTDKLLAKQYKEWARNTNVCAALPIYSFDLMYNIFKRARRHAVERNPKAIKRTEVFQYIGRVYRDILKQLEKQEEFYESYYKGYEKKDSNGADSEGLKFLPLHEVFKNCPYVDYFMNGEMLEQKVAFMADVTKNMFARNDNE